MFSCFALVALLGLWLHVKGAEKLFDSRLVLSVNYGSPYRTKMPTYVVRAFPFISFLAAMALRSLMKLVKHAVVRGVIILPLFFVTTACPRAGNGFVAWNYSPTFSYDGSTTINNDPLIQLAIQARATSLSPTPEPLIINSNRFFTPAVRSSCRT